tara:strand:- start:223 stop:633 length:411 start_codon:yes stop_codon:yes gene_type:complete
MKKRNLILVILSILIYGCSDPQPCDPNLEFDSTEKITRLNDKLYTGRCMVYSEDGDKLSIQQYLNGIDYGKWIFYFENGNIKTKGKFKDGNKVGVWKYFHENGNVRLISKYNQNGDEKGVWKAYDSLGILIGKNQY